MLSLKPNCELCDIDLPANSLDACICSYECTFCRQCVDSVLQNVCPNCGGGFTQRPIRPANPRREGVSVQHQDAAKERVHSKFDMREILEFVAQVKDIPAHER